MSLSNNIANTVYMEQLADVYGNQADAAKREANDAYADLRALRRELNQVMNDVAQHDPLHRWGLAARSKFEAERAAQIISTEPRPEFDRTKQLFQNIPLTRSPDVRGVMHSMPDAKRAYNIEFAKRMTVHMRYEQSRHLIRPLSLLAKLLELNINYSKMQSKDTWRDAEQMVQIPIGLNGAAGYGQLVPLLARHAPLYMRTYYNHRDPIGESTLYNHFSSPDSYIKTHFGEYLMTLAYDDKTSKIYPRELLEANRKFLTSKYVQPMKPNEVQQVLYSALHQLNGDFTNVASDLYDRKTTSCLVFIKPSDLRKVAAEVLSKSVYGEMETPAGRTAKDVFNAPRTPEFTEYLSEINAYLNTFQRWVELYEHHAARGKEALDEYVTSETKSGKPIHEAIMRAASWENLPHANYAWPFFFEVRNQTDRKARAVGRVYPRFPETGRMMPEFKKGGAFPPKAKQYRDTHAEQQEHVRALLRNPSLSPIDTIKWFTGIDLFPAPVESLKAYDVAKGDLYSNAVYAFKGMEYPNNAEVKVPLPGLTGQLKADPAIQFKSVKI